MNRSSVIFSKAVVPDGVFSPLSNLASGTTLKLSEFFAIGRMLILVASQFSGLFLGGTAAEN
jgi:hypothetical protein